ncbi:MAG: polysaccharide pyruvyl transferase CsaB [Lachnospirales bacterium]
MIKLLIAGYHGFGNCGDEAILQAMTTNIKAMAKDVSITALSNKPEFTKTEYGINSVQRFKVLAVISAIRNCDIMLSGGGTLLQNGTSTRSLLYYLAIIRAAKFFGKKVMLYANGIGPVTGRLNRCLVKMVVNKVDAITLREKLSEADLLSIGVKKPDMEVTADPAFGLYSISDDEARDIFKKENIPLDKPTVGVSVRSWQKAMYGEDNYIDSIAKACDDIAKEGKQIVFLPMEYPRDIEISKKVMNKMKCESFIFKNRYSPSQILGITGLFDVMVSMRLHTLIFAAVKCVPMVGIIYDPKVEYYLTELDMPEGGDIRHSKLDDKRVSSIVMDIFDNMSDYKSRLKEKSDIMIEKAHRNDEILSHQLDLLRKKQ